MRALRLVTVVGVLLVCAFPALASRKDGKYGCFTCEVRYSSQQLYNERCNQVLSGQWGNGTFCYTMTMDFATICQLEGGSCYYIEVDGAKAPGRQLDSSASADPKAPKPVHLY